MTVATTSLIMSVLAGPAVAAVAMSSARSRIGDRVVLSMRDGMRALMAGLTAGIVALLVGCGLLGFDMFGAMHVAYLFTVVAAPLVAVILTGVLVVGNRRGGTRRPIAVTRPVKSLLVPILLLAPLGVYMTHIEPYWLSIEEVGPVAIAPARQGDQPIRIGVLTDWQLRHVGEYEIHAVDELLAARPDIILLPGDIFQDSEAAFVEELPALRAQLQRMDVPGGAFLVDGDTDPIDHMRRMTAGTPVHFLDNQIVQTEVRGRIVTIGGTELEYETPAAVQVAADLEAMPGDDDIRILLSHRPDAVYNLGPAPRTDLVVAGHTHGGQVAIPGFGPLMTLSGVPRQVAGGGLFTLEGKRIFVGRGVGVERNQAPQIRLFVRPNIGIVTLAG
jgi:predicted MPP superfamily phosphohydrolase